MPPPPSDDEIKATFTPLEWEMMAWYEENIDNIWRNNSVKEANDIIDARWSKPGEREKYSAWIQKWCGRIRARLSYVMPRQEFVQMVMETIFTNADQTASFLYNLEMVNMPFLVLGESTFGGLTTGYGLQPSSGILWPHLDSPDDGIRIDCAVLGINTNVVIEHRIPDPTASPRKRRLEHSSGQDSTRSTDSGDIDVGGGFTFVQIGALCLFETSEAWKVACGQKDDDDEAIIRGPWEMTRFAVVVRLDSRGQPGGVYVVYNYTQWDDEEGENPRRVHIPMADEAGSPLPHIGRLTDDSDECAARFTVAKIADSLQDLGPRQTFSFDVVSTQECQLVRVKLWVTSSGRYLLREFIRDDR